ncbi:hypothetical protein TNCT_128411 [Trichonephila clavata]|uniref:Uncharacterized protein n=1 Tax=Trichonephila clavata TaxID=2740835 RepID=A0A8X6HRQ0_TRICU|nr:hypothetical protein TNCT_128411 [Trichonephila clavata]
MAILCILKRRSNVVKSVCSCGPTISLSLREIPLEDFADPSNTKGNLSPFFIGYWVMREIKTGTGWNVTRFLGLIPCDQVSSSHP